MNLENNINLYSDNKFILVLGVLIGWCVYIKTDKDFYRISKFSHWTCMIFGIYLIYLKFVPATIFIGFHLAHEYYLNT